MLKLKQLHFQSQEQPKIASQQVIEVAIRTNLFIPLQKDGRRFGSMTWRDSDR
jgi:hypothetical protein